MRRDALEFLRGKRGQELVNLILGNHDDLQSTTTLLVHG
jgi:hypothetical protein